MKYETECAASFWSSKVNPALGQQTILFFESQILSLLCEKFALHWYDDCPLRGQAYREITCDIITGEIDSILLTAANRAGFSFIDNYLPQSGLRMWVDPGEVEIYFISSKRRTQVLYQKDQIVTISPTPTSPRSTSPVYYPPNPEIDYYHSLSYTEPTIDYYPVENDCVYFTDQPDYNYIQSNSDEYFYMAQPDVITSI